MLKEDLAALLTEAITILGDAVKVLTGNDEKILYNKIWKAASDIEYATFLLTVTRENWNDEWKKQWKSSRDIDVKNTLLIAQDLLIKAIEILNSNREEAYRSAWFARGHVLDIQNKLDKDRATRSKPQRSA